MHARPSSAAASILLAGALGNLALADVGPGPRPPRPASPSVVAPSVRMHFPHYAAQKGFVFNPPAGFAEVPVTRNPDMLCEHAVVDAAKRVEVRYALRPFARDDLQRYQDYVNHRLPQGTVITDPNQRGMAEFMAVAMNVSGGSFKAPQRIEPAMARELFDADEGRVATLANPTSQFAKGWQKIMVIQIFKRNVGHAYLFLLFNDDQDLPAAGLAYPAFRALRFGVAPPPEQPILIPPT